MKKFVAMLLAVALCIPVIAIVGCSQEKTLSLLDGKWERFADSEGVEEEVYTITQKDGEKMTAAYEKDNGWQLIKYSMAMLDDDKIAMLTEMNKLVLEGTLTSDADEPKFMLKFEMQAGYPNQEIMIRPKSGEAGRYEWDVSWFNLDKATRMVIFCDPGATAKGELEVTKLEFSSNEVDDQYRIGTPAPILNTITAERKTANEGWWDNTSDELYTVKKNGSEWTVDYNKKNNEWGGLRVLVTGEAMKDFKTVRLTVKGTAGDAMKINFFTGANHESDELTLTGNDDVIVLDITSFIAEVDCSQEHKIIVMAQPGKTGVTGSFTIKNLEFSTEAKA